MVFFDVETCRWGVDDGGVVATVVDEGQGQRSGDKWGCGLWWRCGSDSCRLGTVMEFPRKA